MRMLGRTITAVFAVSFVVVAHSQQPGAMNKWPTNPNGANQDLKNLQSWQDINHKAARDQTQTQAQVAKFMEAIKPRKEMYPDFDKVVLQGNSPVTPNMLGMMAESPYAADIAYYLGQHPEQSAAIVRMQPEQARSAIKQIEAAAASTNPIRR